MGNAPPRSAPPRTADGLVIGPEEFVGAIPTSPPRVVLEPVFMPRSTPTPTPPTPATLVAVNNAVSVPGATVVHRYAVFGNTPAEVIADMEAKGPWVLGYQSPRAIGYTWLTDLGLPPGSWISAGTACVVDAPKLTYELQVWLPSWSVPGPVPPAVAAWWRAALDRLRAHEQHHVNDHLASIPVMEARLRGLPCLRLGQIFDAWAAEAQDRSRAWDAIDLPIIWPAAP